MCFGGSKEPSHRDGSFEYQQHMFWLRKIIFSYTLLSMCVNPDDGAVTVNTEIFARILVSRILLKAVFATLKICH